MKYQLEYKKIMLQTPDIYKLKKYTPISMTNLQVLACLKIFIERDKRKDGWIFIHEMVEILRNILGFKSTLRDIEKLCEMEYDFKQDNINNEKVNFTMFIQIVDILKREKLVLIRLGNNLNYFIFIILITILMIYTGLFYSFKNT